MIRRRVTDNRTINDVHRNAKEIGTPCCFILLVGKQIIILVILSLAGWCIFLLFKGLKVPLSFLNLSPIPSAGPKAEPMS